MGYAFGLVSPALPAELRERDSAFEVTAKNNHVGGLYSYFWAQERESCANAHYRGL